ncbi:recombinase family protein [Rhodophyticola porphyridii]|uniref:Recombinase domain-containing protein n=1 Tax=Rhodophyticola porphyridii TaxID=1852017 RepID=A0A3L9YC31_9RHOB|nr:recombinase family protein [Rhodophyticola porphyridii]RMA43743.1 hypothetical protein D9R08_02125 [Rhodophyticola porphyridii]
MSGGKHFDRGHLQHVLSNPVYAGRIRHKQQVYEGQHPAIIDPEIWDTVQGMLQGRASIVRDSVKKASTSLLAGKLFDETGDRLTPSHSRKNGRRLRYYISHRLVKDRSQKHPDAWRLTAEQLESLIADVIRKKLGQPDIVTTLIREMSASEIAARSAALSEFQQASQHLNLVDRADLTPGTLTVRLSTCELSKALDCHTDRINGDELTLTSPFRMRRRGVELKLHLGDVPPEVDRTLVQNIVKAQKWLAMIIQGKTFAEIAETEGTSKRRVQDVIDLAMLAPDILDAIANGEQPEGLTSDYLVKLGVPAVWTDQRDLFASL